MGESKLPPALNAGDKNLTINNKQKQSVLNSDITNLYSENMQLGYEINTRNLREHIFGEVSNRFGKPELQGIYSDNFTKQPAIQKNRITNEFVSVDNGEGSSILLEQICKMSHSVVYESTDGMKWKLLVVGTSVIIDVSKNSQFTRDRF